MLPPGFERKQTHSYGTFTLDLLEIYIPDIAIQAVEPHFFGTTKQSSSIAQPKLPISFKYQIGTNLWHFYSYLTDCRSITLILTSQAGQVYTAELILQLLPSGQVLNRFNDTLDYLFQENSYLINKKAKVDVYDRSHKVVGRVEIQLRMNFEEQIHRASFQAQLIEFEDILVIDEISPIPSSVDLQSSILQPQEKIIKIPETVNKNEEIVKPQKQKVPREQVSDRSLEMGRDSRIEDDQKMLEDDIDRLIAEMQNKPYDSSRYAQSCNPPELNCKENQNHQNYHLMPQHLTSLGKRSAENSHQKLPPKYPNSIKVNQSPSLPQPIFSYTAKDSFQTNRTNYLMHTSSQPLIHGQSQRSNSRDTFTNQPKKGSLTLKIHELMIQRPESQLSLLLKLYLNDSSSEYYSTNSIRQGQAIIFNSNLKIDQKIELYQLRFQLIDAFDMKSVYCRGDFEMKRLFDLNPAKGIFMVNMVGGQGSRPEGRVIRAQEHELVRVMPNLKSLRIQLQYEQAIEIVQVYLNLSEFNSICKQCRYKIPLTKQTIEFRVSQLASNKHVNIFPHNRSSASGSSQNIIVELWGDKELIGFSEISLKPLYNTNQKMINSSLSPIHLYDEKREIKDFKGGQNNGSFWLTLCYGTISQVQNLLNHSTSQRQARKEQPKKEVAVESHLGIYLKERKDKKEVQIQVGAELIDYSQENSSLSRKTQLQLLQQQELPDDDEYEQEPVLEVSQAESPSKPDQNQFLNKTMQDKYLNRQTVPFPSKRQYLPQRQQGSSQTNLSSTIRDKLNMRSLTNEFQELIKQCLAMFVDQKSFQSLKNQCQEHLLYNFIDSSKLTHILLYFGMEQTTMKKLLEDILTQSNEMVNINMLYDLIYGLLLDGLVKEKYIDDVQMGRYCLLQLYRIIRDKELDQLQAFVFDEDLEFQEARKVYEVVGYKLTMREYNQIQQYLKKEQQGKSQFSYRWVKDHLLSEQDAKARKDEEKKQYEKEVQNKIYSKYQWDDEDDFFISNINQSNHQSQKSEMPVTTEYFPLQPQHISEIQQLSNAQQNLLMPQRRFQKPSHSMTIQGIQACIEAAECHLNVQLYSPKLRISTSTQSNPIEVALSKQQSRESCQTDLYLDVLSDYLDGALQLLNFQEVVARCNFSIIKDVRSVYALKSIKQAQFCGLIYLQFTQL